MAIRVLLRYCLYMADDSHITDDVQEPDLEAQRRELLTEALAQPGVAALVAVYRSAAERMPAVSQPVPEVRYSSSTG